MNCRWHARKQSVWSNSRRKHVGKSRGLDRNAAMYRNNFTPFLSDYKYYNCGNFRHKLENYMYNKVKHASLSMHVNVVAQPVKTKKASKFVLSNLCKGGIFNNGRGNHQGADSSLKKN